ncbi:hypothetical protein FQN57_003310 [Myotisia sp. PD_48]|nr:hypothetical protein FQN57_003310 [Myotisia sp. PD_48]
MPGLEMRDQIDHDTLHLPRIICLHGGGSNAAIFHTQCRVLRSHLKSTFRLCFVDAPFSSAAGPGILPVYEGFGPYYCWSKWPGAGEHDFGPRMLNQTEYTLRCAMKEDDRKGATGEWVGVLGFSQGARTGASILLKQQIEADLSPGGQSANQPFKFRFGVLMNGRGPLLSFEMEENNMDVPATGESGGGSAEREFVIDGHRLRIPTVHVHGLQDPGLELHRKLRDDHFEDGATRLVEWDGGHRIPIKKPDVEAVVSEILEIAKQTGAI